MQGPAYLDDGHLRYLKGWKNMYDDYRKAQYH
jgi:hypothetical protein